MKKFFLVGKVRKNQKGTKVHRREVDIGQALPYYVQMTCVCERSEVNEPCAAVSRLARTSKDDERRSFWTNGFLADGT